MVMPPHHPFSIGRILSLGWSLYRYSWRTMLATAALCLAPAYALMIPVAASFSPRLNLWQRDLENAVQGGLAAPDAPDGFAIALISLLAAAIIVLLAALLASAALVRATDAVYRGQRLPAAGALRDAVSRLLAMVGAQLLFLVSALVIILAGVTVGSVLLVGGGVLTFLGLVAVVGAVAALIFLEVRTMMLAQAVMIDRLPATAAFGRSWRLATGAGWRLLGYLIVLAIIGGLLGLALGGIPSAALQLSDTTADGVATSTIIDALVAIVIAPLGPIVITLLYYDLRWQHGESVPLPGGGELTR